MSSLDIKTFLTGHKEFLKIEKRKCIVRKYLTGPARRFMEVQFILVGEDVVAGVAGSLQAGGCGISRQARSRWGCSSQALPLWPTSSCEALPLKASMELSMGWRPSILESVGAILHSNHNGYSLKLLETNK